ncbi:MAG: hypothetical protein MJ003_06750 [Paludibacteraceae bacterium]|nr:hypothetical protein [Paludibacteraceae bacterium]
MKKTNIEHLQTVAEGMGDLNEQIVYIGGSTVGLYATDPAKTDPRPTNDVDCVVELYSFIEYNKFCELLKNKHFSNDTTQDAPICRWIYKDEIVDVIPDDESILGFTNRWYKPGFNNKEKYTLPSGRTIRILPVTFFVATKLEAMRSRGGNDLRISHDFEDLIYVLNYCPEFNDRWECESDISLKQYIKEQFSILLERPNIREEIECALPLGEDERVEFIIKALSL